MADRPSVKDILAKVRAGGPVAPPTVEQAVTDEAAAESDAANSPEPLAAAPVVSAPPAPTPASLGRPLSLKEKLAAAKNRPAGPEAAAAVSKPVAASASPVESEAVTPSIAGSAAVPVSAAPQLTPEALGRPLTLKEKLAAAKSGGGGAVSPATTTKPAAKAATGTAAASPKAASTRTLPPVAQSTDPRDLAEHLRRTGAEKDKKVKAEAAEKGGPAGKPSPAKKVESKVVPPKPGKGAAAASATAVAEPTRRFFMKAGFWIAAGWATFMGGMAALTSMSLRFMFPNVLAEPPSTIKVGFPADFEPGQVNERWKAEWGFWVVRSDMYNGEDDVYALSTICTHLGCPPNWLASEQKFKCPCHGSGFYISGVNFEGPAPRPLERYKVTIGDDGQIMVDKSQKFQEELGQWKDPESYIKA